MSSIAQAIIALLSLGLAAYILIYQKSLDKKHDNSTALLNEQNIKLQWFKELIIQPNWDSINTFYDKITDYSKSLISNELTYEEKVNINNAFKSESSNLRILFIDVLFLIDPVFGLGVLRNLDELIDSITNDIFDEAVDLSDKPTFERRIGTKISYSKNKLISQIYNYKGM